MVCYTRDFWVPAINNIECISLVSQVPTLGPICTCTLNKAVLERKKQGIILHKEIMNTIE
jgi:hypothetical protein